MRACLAAFFCLCSFTSAGAVENLSQTRSYLGTSVGLTVCYAPDERQRAEAAAAAVWQEFAGVQARMNAFDPKSDVARINAASGSLVSVHHDVHTLIKQSLEYARVTSGVFDITVGPLMALWHEAGKRGRLPTREEIARARALVGAGRIELLDHGRVRLPRGMRIDLGGSAAGFVADKAAAVLREKGFRDFFVDAGGEMFAGGLSCEGRSWRVGIRSPGEKDRVLHVVELKDEALSTSGNYEKYVLVNGERWGHIINPLTGYPERGVVSATVIAPRALDADVFSTALCLLGPGPGVALMDSLGPGYAAMVLSENAQGVLEEKMLRDYAVHRIDP